MSQEKSDMPYYEVPEYYEEYTVGTVTARMVDGLGFRFRWATEDLRDEDYTYKVSEDGRTIEETVNHVLGLSRIVVNSVLEKPTDFTIEHPTLTFEEKRKQILDNLYQASQILQKAEGLNAFNLKFISARGESEYPFWNNINGPIEDAVWHSGQLVMMRRASGVSTKSTI